MSLKVKIKEEGYFNNDLKFETNFFLVTLEIFLREPTSFWATNQILTNLHCKTLDSAGFRYKLRGSQFEGPQENSRLKQKKFHLTL